MAVSFHKINDSGLYPDLLVEINLNGAAFPSDWVDVTPDVRQLQYASAGRNDVLARTQPGSLSMVLNNRAANYDPTNGASPYYPNVKRYIWMRVTGRWAGVSYRRWTGAITGWQQNWPARGFDATVTVTATDLLGLLQGLDLKGQTFSAETGDDRITAITTLAGYDTRADDTGISELVATTTPLPTGTSAQGHILDVEQTENGRIFCGEKSHLALHNFPCIVFQSRHYRILNSASSVATIGDAAGEIPYRDGSLVLDDSQLWDTAEVTTTNTDGSTGTVYTATTEVTDTPYPRVFTRTILTDDGNEAESCAEYLVGLYGQPSSKLPQLLLVPEAAPNLAWPVVLGSVNSQRYTWKRRTLAGTTITMDGFIEMYAESVSRRGWSASWQLLPVDEQSGWVLGDAVNGVLGATTRLVY